jgi:tetratricopeptide (TPR) repeat protein
MRDGARPHFRIALTAAALLIAADAHPDVQPQALVQQAADAAYNLDYDQALALYRQALDLDPESAAAHRGVAALAWLRTLFLRGTVTVDDYLGKLASAEIDLEPPPADLARQFRRHIEQAVKMGEQAVRTRPRDPSAHYALGAALGLAASYQGSIEGRLLPAFRAARRAYDAHEKVLRLDPSRQDAGLVVGTYRYAVSTLPAPLRWIAYLVGFGGGKEQGIALLEAAAAHPGEVQADARFALVLVYNRERRYDDALRVVRQLEQTYPGNRLLWLEEGSTALRAGRPEDSRRALEAGMAKLASDSRPRMPGEEAYWRTKRATALVALKQPAEAEPHLIAALADPDARTWVRARAHLEMGKLADLAGDRVTARREYRAAASLGERSNDPQTREQAKRLAKSGYR